MSSLKNCFIYGMAYSDWNSSDDRFNGVVWLNQCYREIGSSERFEDLQSFGDQNFRDSNVETQNFRELAMISGNSISKLYILENVS